MPSPPGWQRGVRMAAARQAATPPALRPGTGGRPSPTINRGFWPGRRAIPGRWLKGFFQASWLSLARCRRRLLFGVSWPGPAGLAGDPCDRGSWRISLWRWRGREGLVALIAAGMSWRREPGTGGAVGPSHGFHAAGAKLCAGASGVPPGRGARCPHCPARSPAMTQASIAIVSHANAAALALAASPWLRP